MAGSAVNVLRIDAEDLPCRSWETPLRGESLEFREFMCDGSAFGSLRGGWSPGRHRHIPDDIPDHDVERVHCSLAFEFRQSGFVVVVLSRADAIVGNCAIGYYAYPDDVIVEYEDVIRTWRWRVVLSTMPDLDRYVFVCGHRRREADLFDASPHGCMVGEIGVAAGEIVSMIERGEAGIVVGTGEYVSPDKVRGAFHFGHPLEDRIRWWRALQHADYTIPWPGSAYRIVNPEYCRGSGNPLGIIWGSELDCHEANRNWFSPGDAGRRVAFPDLADHDLADRFRAASPVPSRDLRDLPAATPDMERRAGVGGMRVRVRAW